MLRYNREEYHIVAAAPGLLNARIPLHRHHQKRYPLSGVQCAALQNLQLSSTQPFLQTVEELPVDPNIVPRSEEHTSELQSHSDLVCRLLLEKKNTQQMT